MDRTYIMLAEPNPELRWLYECWLREGGYFVKTVDDGPWLLSLAPPSPPDLIIVDRGIGGVDALEACRRLKADADCARVPVIIVGKGEQSLERMQAESAGADAYLAKPFSRNELLICVEKTLIARYQHAANS